jgi:hypothetical protein
MKKEKLIEFIKQHKQAIIIVIALLVGYIVGKC